MTVNEAILRSAEELQRRAETHRQFLARAASSGQPEVPTDRAAKEGYASVGECPLLDCPHRRLLRETLVEAITVLEGTRKAFKSKQLEALRKKLIGVLAEDA